VAAQRCAFLVDDVISTQELVIKKLPGPFANVPLIAGVSILGSGEVVMVPNVATLLAGPAQQSLVAEQAPARGPSVVLIADDSITTRMLYKNILESAGYQVRVACDGQDAWEQLQHGGCQLLISDCEMPRLDGFGLTAKVRGDDRLKDLPVILITSLDSQQDKERGARAGADAYVVKNLFDQEKLLTAIGQLI
jgi:two-component system chemotaxis sensor kinase CheA